MSVFVFRQLGTVTAVAAFAGSSYVAGKTVAGSLPRASKAQGVVRRCQVFGNKEEGEEEPGRLVRACGGGVRREECVRVWAIEARPMVLMEESSRGCVTCK